MAVLLQDAGSGKPIAVKPAPAPPPAKPVATIAYNPAGYVPGGSSAAVGKAIETQAITHPGPTPVQVPATILQELPGVKPAPMVPPLPVAPGSEQPPPQSKPAPDPPKPSSPAPVAPTPNTSGVYSHLELEQLWALANGWPGAEDVAAAVAQAESGGHAESINNTAYPDRPGFHKPGPKASPEYSVGLWQINMLAHPSYTEAELLTPLGNVAAAVTISNNGHDFGAWSTYTSGAYKQHLAGATAPAPTLPAAKPTSTKAPAGVQTAWSSLIGVYGTKVPRQHDQVKALSDSLVTIMK